MTNCFLLSAKNTKYEPFLRFIADQIYAHLDKEKLLPEEQKGCRKGVKIKCRLWYKEILLR